MIFFERKAEMFNFGFLLEGEANNSSSMITTIVMIVVLVLFFYFFMIRPQKKQQKRDEEMRGALQVGDEVTTIGGIIGKVVSIKGDTFVLESTKEKTKIRFLKGAIRSVDVKAADIAGAVIESNKEASTPAPEKEEAAPAIEEATAKEEENT